MYQVALFPNQVDQELAVAAPILKWAGGKGQLLPTLRRRYPEGLSTGDVHTYVEPFVGGGAVFFDVIKSFPAIERVILLDINAEIINLYTIVRDDVDAFLGALVPLSDRYLAHDTEGRSAHYYEVRNLYNANQQSYDLSRLSTSRVVRAAQTLFLNKTGFNGLYRVNRKGHFNVPAGRNGNPTIVNEPRLRAAARALGRSEIYLGDYSRTADLVDRRTFIYYDPPYRPISATSSFKAYAKGDFNDDEQLRLANHFRRLSGLGVKQLLSNSDPTNYTDDRFFDELYGEFEIERVAATRMINATSSGRGPIRELLIRNYEK